MIDNYVSKPTIILADDDPEDREILLNAFHKITDDHYLMAVDRVS